MSDPSSAWPPDGVEVSETLGYDDDHDVRPPPSRRTALLVAGAMLVAVVGGVSAWSWWQDRPGTEGLVPPLPEPILTSPQLAWTWESRTDPPTITAVGDLTLVGQETGRLVALDVDGEETWTADVGDDFYVFSMDVGGEVALAGYGAGVSALALDDGRTVWSDNGQPVWIGDGHVLLLDADGIRELEARSGREEWSAEAASPVAGDGSGVYGIADGRLTKWSHRGRQLWRSESEVSVGSFASVVPADGFVVLSEQNWLSAYDTDDGSLRWKVELGPVDTTVGLLVSDLVYAYPLGREPEAGANVTVYDADGEVFSFVSDESFFYTYPVSANGDDYAVDISSGRFYDARGRQSAETPGQVLTGVEGGAYVQDRGDLVFVTPPDGAEVWRLPLERADPGSIAVGDGRLVVVDGRTVRSYE